MYCDATNSCIPKKNVCDGILNCPGSNIDESALCATCPDNFCKNNGTCTSYESGANCTCAPENVGYYRCGGFLPTTTTNSSTTHSIGVAAPLEAQGSGKKITIGLSVSGSVLVLGIVLIVIYFVFKRRRSDETKLGQLGMTNPAYDMQMGDVTGSAPFTDVLQPSAGLENPLYGEIDA